MPRLTSLNIISHSKKQELPGEMINSRSGAGQTQIKCIRKQGCHQRRTEVVSEGQRSQLQGPMANNGTI